jgi:putative membrane protein
MGRRKSILRGGLAGALGGALGTVVLNVFQTASLEGTRAAEKGLGRDTTTARQQEQLLGTFKNAHMQAAGDVAAVAGVTLHTEQKEKAAPVVEFAFGIGCAAVYGALAEYLPFLTAGYGSLYGGSLFVGAAEAVLPALHYVPPVTGRTAVQHAGGLSGNIVYGVCTEAVRRWMRG